MHNYVSILLSFVYILSSTFNDKMSSEKTYRRKAANVVSFYQIPLVLVTHLNRSLSWFNRFKSEQNNETLQKKVCKYNKDWEKLFSWLTYNEASKSMYHRAPLMVKLDWTLYVQLLFYCLYIVNVCIFLFSRCMLSHIFIKAIT